MKIELKAIQYAAFSSEETNCYSASLYVDGRKIGTVGNDGRGGCDRFHGDRAAHTAADEWCRANLPKWDGLGCRPVDTDLELHCGRLLDDWLASREMKKTLHTCVLFINQRDGKLYQVRHRGEIARTIAAIACKHPGATVLNGLPVDKALDLYRQGTAP